MINTVGISYLVSMFARIISSFFSRYISFIIRKDFYQVVLQLPELETDKPELLLANHFSWWDGFLLFQLNKVYLKKKFHVMVSEENYNRVFFLKYMGAFAIRKRSRQALRSLEYAGKLLDDNKNLVLIFPQGQLHSNHTEQIVFEKGLAHIIKSSQKKFQYLFAATFVDYFQNRKPSAYSYLSTWQREDHVSLQQIEEAYNQHYQTSRKQHTRITV